MSTIQTLRRLLGGAALSVALSAAAPLVHAAELPPITVYKSPTCGCCVKWVDHLKENGFEVESRDVKDVSMIKRMAGVDGKLASCHTALVEGYAIEGHVPAADIKRLLQERPAVRGLAVPGMPIGSPGMEQGSRKDPYHVIAFDKGGNTEVFASH